MKREIGLLLCALVVAGCGGKGSSCVPGQSTACVCSDGSGGAQVCRGDGTYGVCQCGATGNVGGNGGGDMAMGGGGAGGGGSGGGGSGGGGGGSSTGQKRMFVTSAAYAGTAVSGICQAAADSVSLGGTWVPWLSFGADVTPRSAIDEVKGTGPWVRLDGMVAFANHAQLATAPSVPLDVDEHGQTIGVSDVWTGTLTGGS
jgi:hypothetical protein